MACVASVNVNVVHDPTHNDADIYVVTRQKTKFQFQLSEKYKRI